MNTRAVLPLALGLALAAAGCTTSPESTSPESDMASGDMAAEAGGSYSTGTTGSSGTTGSAGTTSGMDTTGGMVPPTDPYPPEPSSSRTEHIHLQELDKNSDGFLDRGELAADHKLAMEFATYDSDGDGRINEAEFHAYVEANTDE